jgi:riboflavin kinase/FMN adenylyltransferase
MRVEYCLGALAPIGPAVLAVGVFDGVHSGHQRLLRETAALAREQAVRAVAVTFWPHPLAVLRPEKPLALLTPLTERLALLEALGLLDLTVVVPYTAELAAAGAEGLLDGLGAWCEPRTLLCEPEDAQEGEWAVALAALSAAAARRGLAVTRAAAWERDAAGTTLVSAAEIRALMDAGRVEDVTALLGRPYRLTGVVVTGDQRGRLLGFPTANLRLPAEQLLPARGVYAVRVALPGETEAQHAAVTNIGVRPTFGGELTLLVEVHLLDVALDLYGLPLRVDLIARLREERRFSGIEALKAQITLDAQQARERLAAGESGPPDGGVIRAVDRG